MQDDASFIASFITKLADSGEHIVLAAHSYGGMPASECVAGLSASSRAKEGKQGGIIRLAFLTAVVPKPGEGLAETMTGGVHVPLEPDEDGWLVHPDPTASVAACFNSIPQEQGLREFHSAIGTHSSGAFAAQLQYSGYKDVPVSWFLCEHDKCVTPEVQEAAISVIEESWVGTEREGEKVDVTRVGCDHFPTVSAQAELRSWFEGLLRG